MMEMRMVWTAKWFHSSIGFLFCCIQNGWKLNCVGEWSWRCIIFSLHRYRDLREFVYFGKPILLTTLIKICVYITITSRLLVRRRFLFSNLHLSSSVTVDTSRSHLFATAENILSPKNLNCKRYVNNENKMERYVYRNVIVGGQPLIVLVVLCSSPYIPTFSIIDFL